ncbi:MAG: nucleotide-binding universal stress UspA family protein [Planctomycetota bacterium]|jgi:nucleotide-binding universal stress UspA family protein
MIKLSRIVCPTDFSPTSSRAVDYAATMAESFGAELVLLHVIPPMDYPLRSFGMSASFQHIQEELETRAKETLDQRMQALKQGCPDINVRCVVGHGEAHDATLKCATDESADMIVLGTHGHTGITHALLGSTAEKVVRLATCPVTTVRTPE